MLVKIRRQGIGLRYAFRASSVTRTKGNLSSSFAKFLQAEYGKIFMVECAIKELLARSVDGRKYPWFTGIITIGSLAKIDFQWAWVFIVARR